MICVFIFQHVLQIWTNKRNSFLMIGAENNDTIVGRNPEFNYFEGKDYWAESLKQMYHYLDDTKTWQSYWMVVYLQLQCNFT